MSAIFGMIRHDTSPVSWENLNKMAGAIKDRGPDGTGLFVEGPIGLGIQRFQTGRVAEPAIIESDGACVLTADARIDNRVALLQELPITSDAPDTDFIKQAHMRWGSDAPAHLLGAFGYAIWNREKKTVSIVRDHIGVRPLYLAQTPQFSAFATDSRCLLALPEVSKDIDDLGIFYFFFGDLWSTDKETTAFAGIKRLPPAQNLEISISGESRRHTYWTLDPEIEIQLADDREYVEAFRECFSRAVARCIPPEGDVGSTLSGGLDSSSIAAMASLQLQEKGLGPLHTYSGVFPSTPRADESQYSRAVSSHGRMIPHEYTPGEMSPLDSVTPLMQDLAQPFFAPNLFLSLEACQAARRDGLRILLDGTDGDTTVGHGRDLFVHQANAHDWSAFTREARSFIDCYGQGRASLRPFLVNQYALPELKRLAAEFRWVELARGANTLGKDLRLSRLGVLKKAWKGRRGANLPLPDFSNLSEDFLNRVQGLERYRQFSKAFFDLPRQRRTLQYLGLTSGAIPLALEALDRIAASHQVEFRFPFCDREFIEFCLSVPARQQLRDGWTRWILRKAMDKILPPEVCWRTGKSNLSVVHVRGMKEFDSGLIEHTANNLPDDLTNYLVSDAPRKTFDRFIRDKANLADYQFLWKMVVLKSWLQNRQNILKYS